MPYHVVYQYSLDDLIAVSAFITRKGSEYQKASTSAQRAVGRVLLGCV